MRDRVFEAVGITETEESVYRGLIRLGRQASATRLAELLGVSLPGIRRALASLEAAGLVSRSPGKSQRFTAARPDIAIQLLVSRRQEELERAKLAAVDLLEEYRQADPGDPAELLEIISGRDAVSEAFRQLQLSATREVLTIDKPPYASTVFDQPLTDEVTSQNTIGEELLGRGVRFRTLYDRAAIEIPGRWRLIQAWVGKGEEARVLEEVPMKLSIADESQALLPLSSAPEGPIAYSIVVQSPSLVLALRTLFETLWRQATAIPIDSPETEDMDEASDRQILALLAAGLKDEVIARQLGMGTRTVRRRLAGLMHDLGARTRFQAGLQAQRRGLIS